MTQSNQNVFFWASDAAPSDWWEVLVTCDRPDDLLNLESQILSFSPRLSMPPHGDELLAIERDYMAIVGDDDPDWVGWSHLHDLYVNRCIEASYEYQYGDLS